MQFIIGLGSNLDDPGRQVLLAADHLRTELDAGLFLSSLFATRPWGFSSTNPFVNAVAVAEADKTPGEVLEILLETERQLGRNRMMDSSGYADRIIDLDLLDAGGLVLAEPNLILPHPRMHLRDFVLRPLAEVLPEWEHPVFHQTANELLHQLPPNEHTLAS